MMMIKINDSIFKDIFSQQKIMASSLSWVAIWKTCQFLWNIFRNIRYCELI